MRLLLSIALALAGFAGCVWAVIHQPMALVALVLGACLVTYSYFMPRHRLVGWMGSLAVAMVAVAPIHLVPSAFRFAELGALALFAMIALLHRGVQPLTKPAIGLVAVYLAVTFFATQAAGIEDAPFQFLMHAIVGAAFLIFGTTANQGERKTIIRTIVFVGVLEALYALYEYVATPAVLWASPVPEQWQWMYTRLANEILSGGLRSQGSFGHPLLLSFLMIVALGLALRSPFKWKLARPAVVGLLFIASIAAGSRSAALIMAGMAIFAYGASRFAWLRGIALTGVVALLAFTSSFLSSDLVQRFVESGSLSHRQGALDAVPRLLSEQSAALVWFGNGFHSRQDLYGRGLLQLDGFVAIDNQFVALLVTTGLFGVAVWVLIIALTYLKAEPALKPVVLGAFGVFLVFDIFEFPATWAILTLLIGLAASSVRESQEPLKEAAPDVGLKRLPEWAAKSPRLVGSAGPRTPGA